MFGQFEFELEFGLEFDCDGVVEDDEPDEDDELPLAAFAIAAPPTAIAPTTTTAASVFCKRVTNNHLLRVVVTPCSQSPRRVETL
jgi:hypothetical protein